MRDLLGDYVRAGAPDEGAIAERLWQLPPDVLSSGDRATLFEQYRLALALADRLGVRRSVTTGVFLVLNTALIALVTVLLLRQPEDAVLLAVPLVAVLGQCVAWFWLVRSLRQLAAVKYAVVAQLEQRLPASPGRAEWSALGAGRDRSRYLPMSAVESGLPALFAVCYVAAFVVLLLG